MKKSTAFVDRLITFLLAAGFLFVGVWIICLYYDMAWAKQVLGVANQRVWREMYDYSWFPWAIGGAMVLLAVIGLWLIIINSRRHHISRVNHEAATTDLGSIRFNVADMVSAAAQHLENDDNIGSAKGTVALEQNQPTISFTVTAPAEADVYAIRRRVEETERDIRSGLGGAELHSIYRIHLDRVER